MSYGIFPRIVQKPNSDVAENSYFNITIDPKFPRYGAALAEERAEFAFKWRTILIPAVPLMIIFGILYWPAFLLGLVLPMLILNQLSGFNREVERVGQSVYCSTASQCYGIPIEKLLDESAEALTTDRAIYPYFYNYPRELIHAELIKHLPAANKWVFKHLPTITKDIKENG